MPGGLDARAMLGGPRSFPLQGPLVRRDADRRRRTIAGYGLPNRLRFSGEGYQRRWRGLDRATAASVRPIDHAPRL